MAWCGDVGGTGRSKQVRGVGTPLSQGPDQGRDLSQPVGDGLLHQVLSQARVVGPVGLDQALVDAPGGLDRSVVLVAEQNLETPGLGIGEQAGSGVQGAPGRWSRSPCGPGAPWSASGCGSGTRRACQRPRETTWKGASRRRTCESSSPAALLSPVKLPRSHSWAVYLQESSRTAASQVLRTFLERPGPLLMDAFGAFQPSGAERHTATRRRPRPVPGARLLRSGAGGRTARRCTPQPG